MDVEFPARQLHRDAAAEERFKEVSEAYGVLSDPDKRARYDRYGHVNGGQGGPGDWAGVVSRMERILLGATDGRATRRKRGP